MANDFETGRILAHPEYGECTVVFVGEDYVGVRFDDGQNALIRKENFYEPDIGIEQEPIIDRSLLPWPESTFSYGNNDIEHFLGSHWEPFFENTDSLVEIIPRALKESQQLKGYGDFFPAPREDAPFWENGWHLIWPEPGRSIISTIRAGTHIQRLGYR